MGTVKDMAAMATDLGSSYIDAPVSGGGYEMKSPSLHSSCAHVTKF